MPFNEEKAKELLRESIDIHVHSGPCIFPRSVLDHEMAVQAEEAGMRAVLMKAHDGSSVLRARLANEFTNLTEIYGGHVMNLYAGGINPFAVELQIKLGARMIWMPTVSAANHIYFYGHSSYKAVNSSKELTSLSKGISVLDENGNLLSEVENIISQLAEAGICLATGHLSVKEIDVLIQEALSKGVKKILVNHPNMEVINMPVSCQKKLSERGVFIEKTFLSLHPDWLGISSKALAEGIREIGAEKCVLSSDYGQTGNLPPKDGFLEFIKVMLQEGITEEEIELMIRRNPAYLLGLDEEES